LPSACRDRKGHVVTVSASRLSVWPDTEQDG
jgi:hypothetical protein